MRKINVEINGYKLTKEISITENCFSFFVEKDGIKYFMKEYRNPTVSDPIFKKFYDNQKVIIDRLNAMGSLTEKYIEHFIDSGIYFQVKELLPGINLMEYLETHSNFEERLQISIILCGMLKNLHSQNIVHQDLKPHQVMLVDDVIGKKTKIGFRMILSDFDWAIPDGNLVRLVGTPYYKSPEHYQNKKPLFQSDIFTTGIMIYELLTGTSPYDFDDAALDEIICERTLKKKIYKKPIELNDEISPEVNDIILKCLEPKIENRPSLDEIQDVLLGDKKEKSQFALKLKDLKYIIFSNKEFGRNELKTFFKEIMDDEGNPIYKYCDSDKSMLSFTKESDGKYKVSAPYDTKNYFLLNEKKIDKEPLDIIFGDILQLYSTTKSKIVASFEIAK